MSSLQVGLAGPKMGLGATGGYGWFLILGVL